MVLENEEPLLFSCECDVMLHYIQLQNIKPIAEAQRKNVLNHDKKLVSLAYGAGKRRNAIF